MKLEEQLQIMEDSLSLSSDPVQVAEVEMLLDQMKDLKCRCHMSSLIFHEMSVQSRSSRSSSSSSSSSKAFVGSVKTNANNCDVAAVAAVAAENDVDDGDHDDDEDINDGSDSYSHSPSVLMRSRIYKTEHSIILSYIDLLQQSTHTTLLPPPQPIVEQLLQCLLDRYTTYLQYLHHQHPSVGIILDEIAEVTTLLLNSYPNSFRTTFRDINFMDAVVVITDINNMIVEKTSSHTPHRSTSTVATKIQELSGIVVPQTQSIPSSSSSIASIKRFIDYCKRQAKSIRSLFHSFTRYPCTVRLLTTRAGSFYWGKRWV
jgi:hypothetical protein